MDSRRQPKAIRRPRPARRPDDHRARPALREDLDASHLTDLRAHCVAFCTAITRHHTSEDGNGFPVLAARHPELAPVLAELARDHEIVADALARLASALDGDRATLRSEVDTIAALPETHFTYEERKIVTALNALTSTVDQAAAERLAATTTLPV
jgi:Hemerythrin HHE cation binding domain